MFDIGFTELILIGVVALVVVGPKRLPVATRTIGTLLGRAQRYVNDVKTDIQRQVDLEELRKVQQQMKDVGDTIQSGVQNLQEEVGGVAQGLSQSASQDWSGFGEELTEPGSQKFGTHILLPEPSWSEANDQRRIRNRVRNRLRKRFHTKIPRDE